MVASVSTRGRFNGKVAVVTGSTEGIGLATVERLGSEGATVVVSSRRREKVDKAVTELREKGISAVGIVCHVGSAEDRKRLREKVEAEFGKLDVLVLNAAVSIHYGPMLDTSEKAWDKTFDVNLKSAFLCVKELVPLMPPGSNIAFISSIAGYSADPSIGAYSVTKTALLGLSKVLAKELVPKNIRVNVVAPGMIETKFSTNLVDRMVTGGELRADQVGTPEQVAAAIAFVTSDDASFMTGESLVVAGGAASRL